MKNKKILNISILLFSLLTLVSEILLFAFTPFASGAATILKVIFWLLNSIALIILVANIIVCLIALFMNDYACIKLNETASLVFLCISFIIALIFVGTGTVLSFGYILVLILAFATSNVGQIARLINAIPTWVPSLKALVKVDVPKTIIDATCKNNKKEEQPTIAETTEEPVDVSDIIAPIIAPIVTNEESETIDELDGLIEKARVTPPPSNKVIVTKYDD